METPRCTCATTDGCTCSESCGESPRESLPCLVCGSASSVVPEDIAHHEKSRHGSWRDLIAGLVVFVLVGVALAFASSVVRAADLPGDSLYQLDTALVDQDGKGSRLGDHRGRPLLITMFYTSCQIVCPLTIATLQKTERAVTPEQRARFDVLMVSFDPDRDNPPALRKTADQHKLDLSRWTLARTDATSVRKLAAALDIQYRMLADGDISHATALVLLDSDGRMIARTSRIGETDPDFVTALKQVLASSH